MVQVLRQRHHDIVDLGSLPLYSGGEADLFALPGDPTRLAKVFRNLSDAERARRVEAMLKYPFSLPPSNFGGIAWPEDILRNPTTGEFVGYVMPRIYAGKPIRGVWSPGTAAFRPYQLRFTIGWAIAWLLAELEKAPLEIILTDINPENVLVDSQNKAWLIDLDSAQLKPPARNVLRSPVGTVEFLSPGLQRKNLRTVDRTRSDESFAAAILFFKLIMRGFHPFSGRAVDIAQDKPELADRIRDGIFVYSSKCKTFLPPQESPEYALLPEPIRDLFDRAFVDGHDYPLLRPSARHWEEAFRLVIESQRADCGRLTSPWAEDDSPEAAEPPPPPLPIPDGTFDIIELLGERSNWPFAAGIAVSVVLMVFMTFGSQGKKDDRHRSEPVRVQLPRGEPLPQTIQDLHERAASVSYADGYESPRPHGMPAPLVIQEIQSRLVDSEIEANRQLPRHQGLPAPRTIREIQKRENLTFDRQHERLDAELSTAEHLKASLNQIADIIDQAFRNALRGK
jgi:serine/threonine protein kinase